MWTFSNHWHLQSHKNFVWYVFLNNTSFSLIKRTRLTTHPLDTEKRMWTSRHKGFFIGPFLASFSLNFCLLKKHQYNFNNKLTIKNVHPVCGAGTWTHDLQNTCLLPKPLHQSYRSLGRCNVCWLFWLAKLETSHVLQGNKNKQLKGSLSSVISVLMFV